MKLLIGVMAFSSFEFQAVAPFCNSLLSTQSRVDDLGIEVSAKIRRLYWRAMFEYVQEAIRGKFDYLFFFDDDVILKPDTLTHLLSRKEPVVSGVYLERSNLHRPVLIERLEEGYYKQIMTSATEGLIEVDCTGFGCMLLERVVFEQLTASDFEPKELTPPGHWAVSKAIRKLGFKIFVDLDCRVGHLSERKEVFEYGITKGLTKGGRYV